MIKSIKTKLEKRIARLEKRILEAKGWEQGGFSKAYIIWNALVKKGSRPLAEVEDAFPEVDIEALIDEGVFIKKGNKLAANRSYQWNDLNDMKSRLDDIADRYGRERISFTNPDDYPEDEDDEVVDDEVVDDEVVDDEDVFTPDIFSMIKQEVQAAINRGDNVNQKGNGEFEGATPLQHAVLNHFPLSILDLLVKNGAHLNDKYLGENILELAINEGDFETLAYLVHANKAVLDKTTFFAIKNPLGTIMKRGNALRKGFDIPFLRDIVTSTRNTPISYKTLKWLQDIVKSNKLPIPQYEELLDKLFDYNVLEVKVEELTDLMNTEIALGSTALARVSKNFFDTFVAIPSALALSYTPISRKYAESMINIMPKREQDVGRRYLDDFKYMYAAFWLAYSGYTLSDFSLEDLNLEVVEIGAGEYFTPENLGLVED